MVVTKVPTVSFVELKCLRMSRVAAALMVEPIGLEGVRMLGWWEVSHLREQGHGRDDDYLRRFSFHKTSSWDVLGPLVL